MFTQPAGRGRRVWHSCATPWPAGCGSAAPPYTARWLIRC